MLQASQVSGTYLKVNNMKFWSGKWWSGKSITALDTDQIFVFGSNPEGRHGLGAAKQAMKFGAKYGKGRGLHGQTYALVTKNLTAGFKEPDTGFEYTREGKCSVPLYGSGSIWDNIGELYDCARENPKKKFLITYQRGSRGLNGYCMERVFGAFTNREVPKNIYFHKSFVKPEFKVIIAGGRDFMDLGSLILFADANLKEKAKTHDIVILSGKAKGADNAGESYATIRKYRIEPYPAYWKDLNAIGAVVKDGQYGKYNANAGFDRNLKMGKAADALIACWDGVSSGTEDMINIAKELKLPTRILNY
jgi:hypothetical protein